MVRTRNGSAAAAAVAEEEARAQREQLERSEAEAAVAAAAALAADAMEVEDYGVEAELTSLSWLQSLDITSASGLPTPPCSPAPPTLKPPPPPPRQQIKKMSPLLKAQLGWFSLPLPLIALIPWTYSRAPR
jgi:hypothetical protein